MTVAGLLVNPRGRSLRTRLDLYWRRIATISFACALLLPAGLLMGFRYVGTSSVPKGLWFVHAGQVAKGEYVFVCLPDEIASLGRRAGYLAGGSCSGESMPLMKRVVAMSGDVVRVGSAGVRVNGTLIAGSRRLRTDSSGHAIPGHVSEVAVRVPAGEIWVLGDWYKSWDSRYFGGIAQSRVIGVGTPLVTVPPGS